ncbi:hypothetical protein SLA_4197 [Streptomyces laurentii]|uniref:Uncharacterized protein n=1 Tax=Streptomyces laurentii TaxID=39478 RepID=A0A160P2X0_STRLU|nr:hypothetical protein SLA_4197 [Streptomyces laurentii]
MLDEIKDIQADVGVLAAALAVHGITLPSLGVDVVTLAGATVRPPLVALGNCTVENARRLIEVLKKAADG